MQENLLIEYKLKLFKDSRAKNIKENYNCLKNASNQEQANENLDLMKDKYYDEIGNIENIQNELTKMIEKYSEDIPVYRSKLKVLRAKQIEYNDIIMIKNNPGRDYTYLNKQMKQKDTIENHKYNSLRRQFPLSQIDELQDFHLEYCGMKIGYDKSDDDDDEVQLLKKKVEALEEYFHQAKKGGTHNAVHVFPVSSDHLQISSYSFFG